MKTLFTIDLKNYKEDWQRSRRDSARAIIHMEADKLALVYATKLGYYKFPGGGINENEDIVAALIREVQEEVGLVVIPQTVKEYGVVHRYQKSGKIPDTIFEQDNFYYECQVQSTDGTPAKDEHTLKIIKQTLDDYEDKAGFELKVVSIKEALESNLKYQDNDPYNILMIARDTRMFAYLLGISAEPSRNMATYLFDQATAKNPGPWREHSLAVAQAAEKIAIAVNQKCGQEKLNPNHAYIYGLLHDIGRQQGYTYIAHVYDGYHFLMSLGYENAARICLTHSFNLQTTDDYIGKIDISPQKMEELKKLLAQQQYNDYDRLIQLLDSTCGADGTQNLEKRMTDVKNRYGYYPEPKWNKNFELKEYFENITAQNFYDMIRNK